MAERQMRCLQGPSLGAQGISGPDDVQRFYIVMLPVSRAMRLCGS